MSVIAMKVESCEQHPNADALKVYRFSAPGKDELRIVANLENVYSTNDIVAVAGLGTTLKDGLKIKKARLRGVVSYGMALGKVDVSVGTDLSATYALEDVVLTGDEELQSLFVAWPSIERFHNIRRFLKKEGIRDENGNLPTLSFRAKVKVDGSNAAVLLLPDGRTVAQSRTRCLTLEQDNYGFAKWVDENREYFQDLFKKIGSAVLFGEWCGKGIQKRTAISKIEGRCYAIFAIQYGNQNFDASTIEIEPSRLEKLMPEHPVIQVLPWYESEISIDFSDREHVLAATEKINRDVLIVEECDPWVKGAFDVDGLGEGLVYYPVDGSEKEGAVERDQVTTLLFKAKGEKHEVVRQPKPAQLEPEVLKSIDAFVEMFVTPGRLEQGLREGCDSVLEMKSLSSFLKWFGQDVKKESQDELLASGLEWKLVSKPVVTAARVWFVEKIKSSDD